MAFFLSLTDLEELRFKQIPEGWLFTAANPWGIGPTRTYIVSDAQRPAIDEQVRRSLRIRRRVMWFNIFLCLFIPLGSVLTWTVFGICALTVCTMMAIRDHRALKPLLKDLQPTTQTIGIVDRVQRASKLLSVRALVLQTALGALGAGLTLYTAVTDGDRASWSAAALMTVFTVLFGAMLYAKLRAKRAEAADAPKMSRTCRDTRRLPSSAARAKA